jgi:chromosome segregation ATPase
MAYLKRRHFLETMSVTVAGMVGAASVVIAIGAVFQDQTRKESGTIEQRIQTLTTSLNGAAVVIAEIEKEIGARQALVSKLKEDAKIAEGLAKLNAEQLNAVMQTLRGELQRQQQSSFWANIGWNSFFTVLGIVLAELYHFFRGRWRGAGNHQK